MKNNKKNYSFSIMDFFVSVLILSIATFISYLFQHVSYNNYNIPVIYILAVIIISVFTYGYLQGILGSVIAIFLMNYFFTYPYFAFDFTITDYPVTFASMLIVSIITSTMTTRIKDQAVDAIVKVEQTNTLFNIAKKLLATREIPNITALTIEYVQTIFNCEAVFYTEEPSLKIADTAQLYPFAERYAANWAYFNKKEAGYGTKNCNNAKGIYIPLVSNNQILGVIGLYRADNMILDAEQKRILNMIVSQVAMAIERQNLSNEQNKILMSSEKEKMRSNLLRAISHDLRTPLTGILGASSTILENNSQIDKETHDKLINDIREDSQWLIRMVENLLSVTRISDVTAKVVKSPEAVEEIVAESISRIKTRFPQQKINVSVPDELLIVPMDATLIEQVLINLMENAIKHSEKTVVISMNITADDENAVFEVADNGDGIADDDFPYLFEGYSLNKNNCSSDSSRGMGIGLSICSSIIKAHSGKITAKNKDTGGAVFTFSLPIKENKNE